MGPGRVWDWGVWIGGARLVRGFLLDEEVVEVLGGGVEGGAGRLG